MTLIIAEKLKKSYEWWEGNDRQLTRDEAKHYFDAMIDAQAAVEAEPIKHGRWLPFDKGGDCMYTCSECGFFRDAYILEENAYCPRCGAKMDLDEVKE